MKIVFLGNFRVDYTSETHYAKTFELLGHRVVRLQEGVVSSDRVYSESLDADMFFWVHTHGWETRGRRTMAEILRKLENKGIPTVAYHLDLYMGLGRWQEYGDHDYFKVKYFFTVDKLMARWLNENTDTRGYYLPAGVFEPECYLAEPLKEFAYDVVFVGSKKYHREWSYRPLLINFLQKTYGDRFSHFGNDGKQILRGDQLNRLYASSKVVVGDSLCKGFDYPYYWSDRVYETTGRGGMIIHPEIEGFNRHFKSDEVPTYRFGELENLKKIIDYYLSHDDEREQIRLAGHSRTLADHTYTSRLADIIERIGL